MLSEIQVPPLVPFQPYFCPSNLSALRLFIGFFFFLLF